MNTNEQAPNPSVAILKWTAQETGAYASGILEVHRTLAKAQFSMVTIAAQLTTKQGWTQISVSKAKQEITLHHAETNREIRLYIETHKIL